MPIFRLSKELIFPWPELAEDGLLAVGGDLSIERLVLAYSNGIFPWYSEGEPLMWWSPDPRMIVTPESLHVSKRLDRTIRQGRFELRFDSDFPQVIQSCSAIPRKHERGTWITRKMINAYCALHEAGYAHSVECWREGVLVGGLYGVSLGAAFFGESMFSREPDASKVAFTHLVRQCAGWNIGLIDCQLHTAHLSRLGAFEIPRAEFLQRVHEAMQHETRRGKWSCSPSHPAPTQEPQRREYISKALWFSAMRTAWCPH